MAIAVASQGLFTIEIIGIEFGIDDYIKFIDSYDKQYRRKIKYDRDGRPFIYYSGMKWYLDEMILKG